MSAAVGMSCEPLPAVPFAPLQPPLGFVPAIRVSSATRRGVGPFKASRGNSAAQKAGLRYEKKVKAFLERSFGPLFISGPWFEFVDQSERRWCQPDGIVVEESLITIVEIKYSWCALAWWQLVRLYAPVVGRAYNRPTRLICITRSFDPSTICPAHPYLMTGLGDNRFLFSDVGVLKWKP